MGENIQLGKMGTSSGNPKNAHEKNTTCSQIGPKRGAEYIQTDMEFDGDEQVPQNKKPKT